MFGRNPDVWFFKVFLTFKNHFPEKIVFNTDFLCLCMGIMTYLCFNPPLFFSWRSFGAWEFPIAANIFHHNLCFESLIIFKTISPHLNCFYLLTCSWMFIVEISWILFGWLSINCNFHSWIFYLNRLHNLIFFVVGVENYFLIAHFTFSFPSWFYFLRKNNSFLSICWHMLRKSPLFG